MPGRQIKTCERCRLFKIKCDRQQPTCQQCRRVNAKCSLWPAATSSTSSGGTSPASADTSVTLLSAEASEAASARTLDSALPQHAHSPEIQDKAHGGAQQHAHDDANPARKRRRRACLSCVRCHRLKVKCDKKQPCTRCRLSGWGRQCAYTHRVEDEAEASYGPSTTTTTATTRDPSTPVSEEVMPFVITEEEPETVITTWHSRHRGLSHWKALLCRVSVCHAHVSTMTTVLMLTLSLSLTP